MENNKIFIGDNLKTMNSKSFEPFLNKVKFIYIDPPYNTLNTTFAYKDKNYNWAEDIQKRLEVSYKFLTVNGVIFISIDDNELATLLQICYKVFGKENYVGLFITKQAQRSNAKHINTIHEYVLAFAKNKKMLPKFYIKRMENPSEALLIKAIINKVKRSFKISKEKASLELKKCINDYNKQTGLTWINNYSNIDEKGNIFFAKDLSTPGKPNKLVINEINLTLEPLKTRAWSSKEKILKLHKAKRLCFKDGRPYAIEYLNEATDNVNSILNFYSRQGTKSLKNMGLYGLFDTPKPVELIKFLIRSSQHEDSLILDFYAGSGTTAQAVYEINKEDKMNHKFILIQLDEPINEKSEAYNVMTTLGYEKPKVSDAMIHRIKTFLKINNLNDNFEIENKIYE
ncbi:adenine-specific DNA-methyltransferase [Metamycoplasma subdolum]|uniref:Adenine-specific DNA-methyltransferase n=1 Tax=Metamycoplasma subdolum TaxID=92407 RepID=A0A3L9ZYQ1_9BACT|nr:DNA methyltransferase [Metamycoplasma subdolum]RMA77580.1 adenine-specific DNA-methyltransferase [Metamycoplasma subdolum]WPB50374.1 DNA methyltransferase [Metamycoplasma subdolum]